MESAKWAGSGARTCGRTPQNGVTFSQRRLQARAPEPALTWKF